MSKPNCQDRVLCYWQWAAGSGKYFWYWVLGPEHCVWGQDKGRHNQIPNTANDPSTDQHHQMSTMAPNSTPAPTTPMHNNHNDNNDDNNNDCWVLTMPASCGRALLLLPPLPPSPPCLPSPCCCFRSLYCCCCCCLCYCCSPRPVIWQHPSSPASHTTPSKTQNPDNP